MIRKGCGSTSWSFRHSFRRQTWPNVQNHIIDYRHTWECPRNQSGRARNAPGNVDRKCHSAYSLIYPKYRPRALVQYSAWMSWRCPHEGAEGPRAVHFRVQSLILTKIWMRIFCSLPKVQKRWEAFRNDNNSERNLSLEYAERLLN